MPEGEAVPDPKRQDRAKEEENQRRMEPRCLQNSHVVSTTAKKDAFKNRTPTFSPLLPAQFTSLQFFQKATKFHIGRVGMCCDHSFIHAQEAFPYICPV